MKATTIGTTVHNTKSVKFSRMNVDTFQSYKITVTDETGEVFELSMYVDNADVEKFEQGWNRREV